MLKSTLLYIKQGLNTHIGAFSPVIIIEDHIYRVLFTHSDGKKYYVSHGFVLTNTQYKIDGVIYTFDENGVATPKTPHYK